MYNDSTLEHIHIHVPHHMYSDCLGCAVLLCLVVCLTLLASFFLPSHLSLKHVLYTHTCSALVNFPSISPTQCFEGLKAFKGVDGKIRLFRPMENMKRMSRSAVAISLPVSVSQEYV